MATTSCFAPLVQSSTVSDELDSNVWSCATYVECVRLTAQHRYAKHKHAANSGNSSDRACAISLVHNTHSDNDYSIGRRSLLY